IKLVRRTPRRDNQPLGVWRPGDTRPVSNGPQVQRGDSSLRASDGGYQKDGSFLETAKCDVSVIRRPCWDGVRFATGQPLRRTASNLLDINAGRVIVLIVRSLRRSDPMVSHTAAVGRERRKFDRKCRRDQGYRIHLCRGAAGSVPDEERYHTCEKGYQ